MSEGSHAAHGAIPASAAGKAAPICSTLIEGATLTMDFGDGGKVHVTYDELAGSPVDGLAVELALIGASRILTNAYSAVRDKGAHEAHKATLARKHFLLTQGIPQRGGGEGGGSRSALDVAIEVMAEVFGHPVEQVRAIVMGYTTKVVHHKDGTSVTLTPDAQRDAFLAKIKSAPETAGLYATKRARKAAAPRSAEDFLNAA